MKRVFADAGYWIALLNPRDAGHDTATQVSRSIGPARMITSEMVLTELLNAFASKGRTLRDAACSAVTRIRSDPNAEIVPIDKRIIPACDGPLSFSPTRHEASRTALRF